MYLLLDTETTGLPPHGCPDAMGTVDLWPRMVQIAWTMLDDDLQVLTRDCRLVQPHGYCIPPAATAVHRITHEEALAHGEPVEEVLHDLCQAVSVTRLRVCHNVAFDHNVVLAELLRLGRWWRDTVILWRDCPAFCTMLALTQHCALPGPRGQYKYPRLPEAYRAVVGPLPTVALHSADVDCELLVTLLQTAVAQKLIVLPKPQRPAEWRTA